MSYIETIDGHEYDMEESEYVEYRVIEDKEIKNKSAAELESLLNVEGRGNWELVTVIGVNVIFKRFVTEFEGNEI